MDFSQILQAIGTLGFPIACTLAMMWYVKYSTDQNRTEVKELNEIYRQEMAQVTEALNNNTLALQKLCDKLDG